LQNNFVGCGGVLLVGARAGCVGLLGRIASLVLPEPSWALQVVLAATLGLRQAAVVIAVQKLQGVLCVARVGCADVF
jgi:hypothetical protein